MLHNPAALYLACHFLFKVFALTVTVICLQCLQILYKSLQSGNTKISEFFCEKQCRKITFVLILLKRIMRFCSFHHGIDVSHFYFQNCSAFWVQQFRATLCCIVFSSPVPLCSIKWCFKDALMFRASFEPNANMHTSMDQENARPDSLPDTSTRSFVCAALGKKSLEYRFICQTNSVIVFGDLKWAPTAGYKMLFSFSNCNLVKCCRSRELVFSPQQRSP